MGMSENRAQRAVLERLFALQDTKYRAFQSKLMPTVAPETVIGVRTPLLRNLAKELAGTAEAADFLRVLPHAYYEENNLHAFLVEKIRDYDAALAETERFLPYIDNWATCDSGVPAVFKKHKNELLLHVYKWLNSDKPYTVRYGIGTLMRLYLDEDFDIKYALDVAKIRSKEYYVNMMKAWYIATALAKQYDAVLPILQERLMDSWSHNKAIQKARESYRITPQQKEYLSTLKV